MKNYFFKMWITSFSAWMVSALIFFVSTSSIIFDKKSHQAQTRAGNQLSYANNQPSAINHQAATVMHGRPALLTGTGLPLVFNKNHGDLVAGRLRHEAMLKYALCGFPLSKQEWDIFRGELKNKIIAKTGALVNQKLPLDIKETGSSQLTGYSVKNIAFQTRPGTYATANLYVPGGTGRFPAVIVMMGHSPDGRLYDKYQSVGITLALNGYVSLCIDPWGAGERTTVHGQFEDHGDENSLGAALMNIGETLMGMQITDNIRGVDLLCSLPYVDPGNIGATGSSGGGGQAMWLTAMDERVKAVVPVVSTGTFEAFVMGSPCICEVLPDGLTFTEEAGVLGLIAPRAVKMCNHYQDDIAAFNPREMLRTYNNAVRVFAMVGAENNIAYQAFELTHGYWPADREAMLGWFNLHLKSTGKGEPVKELAFTTLPVEQLMVYPKGKRPPDVTSTAEYCTRRGNELRKDLFNSLSFDTGSKKNDLRKILRVNEKSTLKNVHRYPNVKGWDRIVLETSDDKLLPVLLRVPSPGSKDFVILCDPAGKENISPALVEASIQSGSGIAIIDLSGTGETSSASLHSSDSIGKLRVLSKSCLLLGKTMLGEWMKELNVLARFIKSDYRANKIIIDGTKEAGLAGLYLSVLEPGAGTIILRNAPPSYLFDKREHNEFFSTGIYLPGFLNWGDVSLVAALSGADVHFINPVTMSGEMVSGANLKTYKSEFDQMKKITGQPGKTAFN